jgi:pullulanase
MSTTLTKTQGVFLTTQLNSQKVPGFAFFSDTIRDGLKGSVFENTATGFVSGAQGKESEIAKCFLGLAGSWCKTPAQSINYASCHDNNTLWDRLLMSRPDASQDELIKMNNLSAAIVMMAQGIPFFQAGEEMLRTKPLEEGGYDHNSYSSPDSVNSIKWSTLEKEEYQAVVNYYKGLIEFRKAHPVLRLSTPEAVQEYVAQIPKLDKNVIGFTYKGGYETDANDMIILFNANAEKKTFTLPEGEWDVFVNGSVAGTTVLDTITGTADIDALSTLILVKHVDAAVVAPSAPFIPVLIGVVIGLCVSGAIIGTYFGVQRKKVVVNN